MDIFDVKQFGLPLVSTGGDYLIMIITREKKAPAVSWTIEPDISEWLFCLTYLMKYHWRDIYYYYADYIFYIPCTVII